MYVQPQRFAFVTMVMCYFCTLCIPVQLPWLPYDELKGLGEGRGAVREWLVGAGLGGRKIKRRQIKLKQKQSMKRHVCVIMARVSR